MSEQTTQPVVDAADTQAKPASEAGNARNEADLETLLAVYDQETSKPAPQPAPAAAPTQPDNAVLDEIKSLKGVVQEYQQDKFKAQITDAVKAVRGDIPDDVVDDEMVEAWLDARARKDPRLAQAWLAKANNPRQWQRIQSELGREFKKKFDKMPDKALTEDREVVAAAVRGASTRAPSEQPTNMAGMSNAEARQYVRASMRPRQ